MNVNVFETNIFSKATKRLHTNQITELKKAIEEIKRNPEIGEMKKGDLAGVRVHKFHFHHQLVLLAYTYESNKQGSTLTLLNISSHENFTQTSKSIEIKWRRYVILDSGAFNAQRYLWKPIFS